MTNDRLSCPLNARRRGRPVAASRRRRGPRCRPRRASATEIQRSVLQKEMQFRNPIDVRHVGYASQQWPRRATLKEAFRTRAGRYSTNPILRRAQSSGRSDAASRESVRSRACSSTNRNSRRNRTPCTSAAAPKRRPGARIRRNPARSVARLECDRRAHMSLSFRIAPQ